MKYPLVEMEYSLSVFDDEHYQERGDFMLHPVSCRVKHWMSNNYHLQYNHNAKGSICESGTHDELLNQSGLYVNFGDVQERSRTWKIAQQILPQFQGIPKDTMR